MKAKITRLLPLLALFIFTKTLRSQQPEPTPPVKTDVVADPSGIEKIVIRTIIKGESGQPENSVIVLKGDAASGFDLKKWMAENPENTSTEVIIEKEDGGENIFRFKPTGAACEKRKLIICGGDENPRGFLGVMPADESETGEGLPVEIVRESAAAEAGMVENDVILGLNDSKIDTWDDLSQFMKTTKPGDEIKITFRHEARLTTKTVKLGTQKSEKRKPFGWADEKERWGNNVHFGKPRGHENWPKKEACLGVYGVTNGQISSENSSLAGAKITSFVKDGAAEPAGIQVNDVVTAIDGSPVKTYNELYKTIAEYQPGDKVSVSFQRGELKKSLDVVLKACEPRLKKEVVVIKNAAPSTAQPVENQSVAQPGQNSQLALESFSAFPNPSDGRFTIQFKSEPGPTLVRLMDLNGRVLFNEEINSFDGFYEQEFDLREAAKGTILVSVSQGEKIFSSQLILN